MRKFERGVKGESLPGTKTAFRNFRKMLRKSVVNLDPTYIDPTSRYSYAYNRWVAAGKPA